MFVVAGVGQVEERLRERPEMQQVRVGPCRAIPSVPFHNLAHHMVSPHRCSSNGIGNRQRTGSQMSNEISWPLGSHRQS